MRESGERPCSILASCIARLEAGGEIAPNSASQTAQMNYLGATPVLLDDNALVGLLGSVRRTGYAEGLRLTLVMYRNAAGK